LGHRQPEQIVPDLYRIRIPLPDTPLKYLNSYVVKSRARNLLIDTGFNNQICLDAMRSGLNDLDIDLEKTDIFITHFHADHFSLVPELKTPSTRVYFNRPEAELLENWQGFGRMLDHAQMNGFPKSDLKSALEAHPGSRFGVSWVPGADMLSEGYSLNYGDYRFTCLETPGHTLGHICLYESGKKILVSGDHVLSDITPNIQCWDDHQNPLKQYLSSLDKVKKLGVELVLPGHRSCFSNLKKRVDELRKHHEGRLDEILHILDQGPQTAFDIASKMSWEIKASSWNTFPLAQKWFATGEALSHLRYLEEVNRVSRKMTGNRYVYNRN
jgi:glyoxylase-like metal-dependent hydrolase (beta-lactamase superfamily II)